MVNLEMAGTPQALPSTGNFLQNHTLHDITEIRRILKNLKN